MTPVGAVRRAFDSLSHTKDVLKDTRNEMIARLPDQKFNGEYPEGDIRNIKDAKLRYQTMYAEHQWTPAGIEDQVKACRRTKLTAFVMAILAVAGVVTLAISAPLWLTICLMPVACVTLLLGAAKGFQYALYETQMDLEELISAREFVSRNDFFQRLIG